MFYLYLSVESFLFFLTPIWIKASLKSKSIKLRKFLISLYILWIFFYAYLTYVPFIFWYIKNDINIQTFLSLYGLILVVIIFSLLPFLYLFFILNIKLSNLLRKFINIFALLILIFLTIIIFGIKIYNYRNVLNLNDICYQKHYSSENKLSCSLKAEYVWNEGFAFVDKTPLKCQKFMNWND